MFLLVEVWLGCADNPGSSLSGLGGIGLGKPDGLPRLLVVFLAGFPFELESAALGLAACGSGFVLVDFLSALVAVLRVESLPFADVARLLVAFFPATVVVLVCLVVVFLAVVRFVPVPPDPIFGVGGVGGVGGGVCRYSTIPASA